MTYVTIMEATLQNIDGKKYDNEGDTGVRRLGE